jgi:hypothetical protein
MSQWRAILLKLNDAAGINGDIECWLQEDVQITAE